MCQNWEATLTDRFRDIAVIHSAEPIDRFESIAAFLPDQRLDRSIESSDPDQDMPRWAH